MQLKRRYFEIKFHIFDVMSYFMPWLYYLMVHISLHSWIAQI